MQDELEFTNEFISDLKKKIITYLSHNEISINKVNYNLSLFNQFIINDNDTTNISVTYPNVQNNAITKPLIEIDIGFFNIRDNQYYVKAELEDEFLYKLTSILVEGASITFKWINNRPVDILSIGLSNIVKNTGVEPAVLQMIVEDITEYILPDNIDKYSFNKKIIRMISSIIGKKAILNTYLGLDDKMIVSLISLSENDLILDNIDNTLELINKLINTLTNSSAHKNKHEKDMLMMLIKAKKGFIINKIIDELYIPMINSVGFDQRKYIRDEILTGFLGNNYANLKLNDDNKDSYYWASIITNAVPINNIVGEKAKEEFNTQIKKEYADNIHDIYVKDAIYKTKENIKEFLVIEDENGSICIKNSMKKIIRKQSLIEEILSYAYINCITDESRKKLEAGITHICEKENVLKSSLKGNPLNNKMLIACIKQLAHKNGYNLEEDIHTDTSIQFKIVKK